MRLRDEFFGLTSMTEEKNVRKHQWLARTALVLLAAGSLAYLAFAKGIEFTVVLVLGLLLWVSGTLAGFLGISLFSSVRSKETILQLGLALTVSALLTGALIQMDYREVAGLSVLISGGVTLVSALMQFAGQWFVRKE